MTVSRRRWALSLIAALVILNGIVLTWLMNADAPAGSAEPTPTSTTSLTSDPTPQTSSPQMPGETTDPASPADPALADPAGTSAALATRQLVAVDGDVAWRSTLASCGQGAAIVERTVDGGDSWTATDLDVESVVRLRATDARSAFVVGVDQGCQTALATTSDGGETWGRADVNLSATWFLAPTDRTLVVGPRGEAPVPCPGGAIDLAAVDVQRGAVLCQDGSLAVSTDGGRSWATTGSVAGARAIAQNGSTYAVATFEGPCDALSVYGVNSDGEVQGAPLACAPVTTAADVAVSISDDLLWVWSGTELAISQDGGQTW